MRLKEPNARVKCSVSLTSSDRLETPCRTVIDTTLTTVTGAAAPPTASL